MDTPVSVDGIWQKRGFSSLHGIVTTIAIESGKILDSDMISRNCQSCNSMENFSKTDSTQCYC